MDKDIADDPEDKIDEDKDLNKDIAEDLNDKKEDYMKNLYVNDNFETGWSFIMIKSVDKLSKIINIYIQIFVLYTFNIFMIIALEEPATEEHSLLSGRFSKLYLYLKRTKTYYKIALTKMISPLKNV